MAVNFKCIITFSVTRWLLAAWDRAAFELVRNGSKPPKMALIHIHPLFQAAFLYFSFSSQAIVPESRDGRESGGEGREALMQIVKQHVSAKMEARQEACRCDLPTSFESL